MKRRTHQEGCSCKIYRCSALHILDVGELSKVRSMFARATSSSPSFPAAAALPVLVIRMPNGKVQNVTRFSTVMPDFMLEAVIEEHSFTFYPVHGLVLNPHFEGSSWHLERQVQCLSKKSCYKPCLLMKSFDVL